MNRSAFLQNQPARGEAIPSAPFPYSFSGTDIPPKPGKPVLPADAALLAVNALLEEVRATPKPGLVDLEGNGAHRDMDVHSFTASAMALRQCFFRCGQAGMAFPNTLPKLASVLRQTGLDGEQAMYQATGGINTHKGAIFSLGILCAACTMGFENLSGLQKNCAAISSSLLKEDTASGTHGLTARATAGTGGIRKEACSGFDTAFSVGLPALEDAGSCGLDFNDSLVYALLRIMTAAEDSNLVHRGGPEALDFAKKEAERLTSGGPESLNLDAVRRLDGEFIKRNLSPGGAADLLAFSAMLYRIKKGNHHD